MTNAWIAEKSGVPESTVTKVMNGTNKSPTMATIIPMAEALGVQISSQTIERIAEETIPKAAEEAMVNHTIAAMERAHEKVIAEKDRRIEDKDKLIRILWIVIIVLAILFLLCVIGFVALYIYDHSVPDRGWITQYAGYVGDITGKIKEFFSDIFSL